MTVLLNTFSLLFLFLVSGLALVAAERRPPNIVLLLADDLGYADLSSYGATDIRTPAIDRLGTEGVRFTQFYSNGPDCSPTRAALLTGRYQQRIGGLECAIGIGGEGRYDDAIRLAKSGDLGLPAGNDSLAQRLRRAGYRTAILGKWHLGYGGKFSPMAHGFEHALYALGGGMDYFFHVEEPPDLLPVLRLNGEPVQRDGYFTDILAEEAEGFIARHREEPFFLFVSFTAPHAPYQGADDVLAEPLPKDSPLWRQNNAPPDVYHRMIESMDGAVARIDAALHRHGLAENTLIVFTSDNGGTRSARPSGLREIKGTTFEGGIRVPCLARWPGVLPAGQESGALGVTMDLTVSFAAAAGQAAVSGEPFDGIDLLGSISRGEKVERSLFWRGRRGMSTWAAARMGELKYVRRIQNGKTTVEGIYDLRTDPGETRDLLPSQPEVAAPLKAALHQWEVEVAPTR